MSIFAHILLQHKYLNFNINEKLILSGKWLTFFFPYLH